MAQVASTLDYSKRFGAGVTSMVAQAHLKVASESRANEAPNSTKYSRWFFGEDTEGGATVSKPRLRPIDIARMAAAEIAEATLSNLNILGDDQFDLFASKLPSGHKMRKEIRPSLISKVEAPWLGSCKIGQILGNVQGNTRSVQQFFIGNFDADIDTSGKGSVYKLKSKDFSQTFFSLHMLLDAEGRFKGFDQSKGDDGLAFHTSDMREAHFAIASAAMGIPIEQLKLMMQKRAA